MGEEGRKKLGLKRVAASLLKRRETLGPKVGFRRYVLLQRRRKLEVGSKLMVGRQRERARAIGKTAVADGQSESKSGSIEASAGYANLH